MRIEYLPAGVPHLAGEGLNVLNFTGSAPSIGRHSSRHVERSIATIATIPTNSTIPHFCRIRS